MTEPRIVVTGAGVISSIGKELDEFWSSLLEGRTGAAAVTSFDTTELKRGVGCEVRDFQAAEELGEAEARLGRASQIALYAARKACGDAGFQPDNGDRMGVCIGTTLGEPHFIEELDPRLGPGSDLSRVVNNPCSRIAESISTDLNISGPTLTIPTACAAGNYAIGAAYDYLQRGEANVMLAGGSDAFSRLAFIGFCRLHAMSPDVCRPFDKNRKGLLLGEGAGILLLETLESARKRNARIYAEVLGYGLSCDAFHITGPQPEGRGAAQAMRRALHRSAVDPERIDYINAHGTGTLQNDQIETRAIKEVFRDHSRSVAVSSIKALTGHAMGASSAIESIACVLAITRRTVPPTWNYQDPDPSCDLDYTPNEPRERKMRYVLNNAYAFGGNNACVVFGAV